LTFFQLLNNVVFSDQCITYAVFFKKPQRHTAAGAAVTYRIEVMLPFDDGMYEAILVALL
jgi:hypothetical protein